MRKTFYLLFLTFFSFVAYTQPVFINLGTTTVETSTLYTTSELPWELKYGPGDSLWMTTRQGRVYRIHPSTGGATLLLDHSASVWQVSESGMLGMAFHPSFASNPYVYIVYNYTTGGNNRERLSRFTYAGNSLINEMIIIDANIAANGIHNGSRLVVLADNTILMTTGDANNTANSQSDASLNGKILRVNLDGTIPANNPNPASRIYSKGHRNPQGLMLHPNGRVYQTEHGPGNNDEFQIIEPGRNYGWPNVEGFCDNDKANEITFCNANNVKEPLASWNVAPGGTWAPNDLIWYSSAAIPEFQNSFLVTFLKTAKIRRIYINASGDQITGQQDFFVNQWGRLRDITSAPNGEIFIATNSSPNRIIRVRNPAAGPVPVNVSGFKAACKQGRYHIEWTTQQEKNSNHFILMRSYTGQDYEILATIPSRAVAGNSDVPLLYTFNDGNSVARAFYKLVSVDFDGSRKEWGIVSAACGNPYTFTLSPNPARNAAKLKFDVPGLVAVKVYNTAGALVFSSVETNEVNLPVNKWAADVYILTVSSLKNQLLYRDKLIIK